MNLKTIAVTALTLISYLNTINAMPEAVEVADSVSPGSPTAPIDTVGEPGYMDLEEFVIVQQKKLVESDGAKLTYYYCPLNYNKVSPTSCMTEVGLTFCI